MNVQIGKHSLYMLDRLNFLERYCNHLTVHSVGNSSVSGYNFCEILLMSYALFTSNSKYLHFNGSLKSRGKETTKWRNKTCEESEDKGMGLELCRGK